MPSISRLNLLLLVGAAFVPAAAGSDSLPTGLRSVGNVFSARTGRSASLDQSIRRLGAIQNQILETLDAAQRSGSSEARRTLAGQREHLRIALDSIQGALGGPVVEAQESLTRFESAVAAGDMTRASQVIRNLVAEPENTLPAGSIIHPAQQAGADNSRIAAWLGEISDAGLGKSSARTAVANTNPPEAADLAETPLITFTAEIRALARSLGHSPSRIFAFVHDNVRFEPYLAAAQSAQAVYYSQQANNIDTTTFLIALLRAANIPARYVSAFVDFRPAELTRWLGVADTQSALDLARDGLLVRSSTASAVQAFHVWAEAWVDGPQGKHWVVLDPSYKAPVPKQLVSMPRQRFDRTAYLARGVRADLPSDAYETQVATYLRSQRPGASLSDVYPARMPAPANPDSLPQPPAYQIANSHSARPDLASAVSERVEITLQTTPPTGTPVTVLTRSFSVPEISLQSLSLGFSPTSPAPGATLTPHLYLDDRVVVSGPPQASGATLSLRIRILVGTTDLYPSAPVSQIRAGDSVGIGLDSFQVSDRYIGFRIGRILARLGTANPDLQQSLREILHVAVQRYFQRQRQEYDRAAGLMQIRRSNAFALFGVAMAPAAVQRLATRPLLVTPTQYFLDITGANIRVAGPTGPLPAADKRALFELSGLTGSALEHELWEELALTPSVSTARALQVASQTANPIITIPPGGEPMLNGLPISQNVKTSMARELARGRSIVTSSRAVQHHEWNGVGYIAEEPDGSGAYMIQQLNGGATATGTAAFTPRPAGSSGNPLPQNGATTGDPVNISNGNMFHQVQDFFLSAPGMPLQLVRTYNSQVNEIGPFGVGWTHSYNMTIKQQGTSLVYRNPTGGNEVFTPLGTQWAGYRGERASREGTGWRLRFRYGLEFHFDANGKLINLADPNGNRQTLHYNTQGNLATVTDAAGRQIVFSYDARNRVTSITDFAGRQRTYQYDAAGDLVEARDPAGQTTRYAYYGDTFNAHNMKSVTDPEGNITSWVYYADDKAYKIVGPGGGEMQLFYLPFRNETIVVDERGQSRTYRYDLAGRITMMTDPLGNFVTRKYTAEGWLAEETDAAGYTIRFNWDPLGNLTKIVDPLGNVTEIDYDPAFSRVTQTRDARGNVQRFEYDTKGNLTKFVDATGVETRFEVDSRGYLTAATGPDGNIWSFAYDVAGNPTQLTDPLRRTLGWEYNAAGYVSAFVDPLGGRSQWEYDSRDLITRNVDALGNEATFAYDRAGRIARVSDGNHQAQQIGYDTSSNLESVTAADRMVQYRNAPDDCRCTSLSETLSQVKDAKGAQSAYKYDPRGFLAEVRNAMGNAIRYSRDARGNLAELSYDDGTVHRFSYDANNRLISRSYPDGSRDIFTYDAVGNLLTAGNANVTYTFTYDARNQVIAILDSRFAQPLRYAYDSSGRRELMTDPQGAKTIWAYLPDGALESIQSPNGQLTRFSYDASRRRQKVTFPNQTEATYSYDAAGRLVSLVYTNTASGEVLNRFEYTYDGAGNRTSMTDLAGTHRYSYDSAYRLIAATHPDQDAEQYTYDAAGNRTVSHRESFLLYDVGDRLTRTSGAEYLHDQRGNLVTRTVGPTTTYFKYSSRNQLEGVEMGVSDAATIKYKYDPFGRRIEKGAGGAVTRYLYDFEDIALESDESGSTTARYTHGPGIDEPLLIERDRNADHTFEPSEGFFYQSDGLGSVRALTDHNGDVYERYSYDSFGNLVSSSGTIRNPYFFTGREWDEEAGLYYYRARHYDPFTGRFLQRDTIWRQGDPETLNLYTYTSNNPVKFIDPSGREIVPTLGEEPLIIRRFKRDRTLGRGHYFTYADPVTRQMTAYDLVETSKMVLPEELFLRMVDDKIPSELVKHSGGELVTDIRTSMYPRDWRPKQYTVDSQTRLETFKSLKLGGRVDTELGEIVYTPGPAEIVRVPRNVNWGKGSGASLR